MTSPNNMVLPTNEPYIGAHGEVTLAASEFYTKAVASGNMEFDPMDELTGTRIWPTVPKDADPEVATRAIMDRHTVLTARARSTARMALNLDKFSKAGIGKKILFGIEIIGQAASEPIDTFRMNRSGVIGQVRDRSRYL